jgi:hypothetical protein
MQHLEWIVGGLLVAGLTIAPTHGSTSDQPVRAPGSGLAADPAADVTVLADLDTYLDTGDATPHGADPLLMAGFQDGEEARAYFHFPLDAEALPPTALTQAYLWIYLATLPETDLSAADFQARGLTEAFRDDAVYPPWIGAGDPTTTVAWSTETAGWLRMDVVRQIGAMLAGDGGFGLEVSASESAQGIRLALQSLEATDPDLRPRLILRFAAPASPTPTPGTPSPTPSQTPTIFLFMPRALRS